MPTEPRWLSVAEIERAHDRIVAATGGLQGLRDEGLLVSAVERPRTLYAYGEATTLHELATAYAEGIGRNHAFLDGNKRSAFLSAELFLSRNGFGIAPADPEREHVEAIKDLAQGKMERAQFALYLKERMIVQDANAQ